MFCFLNFIYWFLEREGQREKHHFVFPPFYAFIGWFLPVPWPGFEPSILVYWEEMLTNWDTWPQPPFHFLDHVLLSTNVFNLNEAQFFCCCCCYCCLAIDIISKKPLPNPSPMLFSKSLKILAFIFRSLIHFQLISEYNMRRGPTLFFWSWVSSQHNCWKLILSPFNCLGTLVKDWVTKSEVSSIGLYVCLYVRTTVFWSP